MINKKNYSDMMNEIHVPSEVLGKVINMKKERKIINRKKIFRTLATTAAAIVGVFAASNAICYAATGETLVETFIIYINGEATETEMTYSQDGDTFTGKFQYDLDKNPENNYPEDYDLILEGVDGTVNPDDIIFDAYEPDDSEILDLIREDDKLYIQIPDYGKIDVTEDAADGNVFGTVIINEIEYEYSVTYPYGKYIVNLHRVTE